MSSTYGDLIESYVKGGEKLSAAIKDLTREELLAFPVPGTWSIQQIVIHVMDSDLIVTDRLKRMVAEANPTLIGYDETKFSKNLFYNDQPAAEAVTILDLNRKLFARVLRKLPEETFKRTGNHNERGQITVGSYLKVAVDHLDHHLKFINEKRALLKK
jgi:uncharacterized damage-inducible protein DinB